VFNVVDIGREPLGTIGLGRFGISIEPAAEKSGYLGTL
jgi:hypothetical protein